MGDPCWEQVAEVFLVEGLRVSAGFFQDCVVFYLLLGYEGPYGGVLSLGITELGEGAMHFGGLD